MLNGDIARYIALRQSLGFKIRVAACLLRRFGEFAEAHGDSVVHTQIAMDWAAEAPSPAQRRERLNVVRRFALHMQAENERYEIPPSRAFGNSEKKRRMPHIYTLNEVHSLLRSAAELTPVNSIRPTTFVALLSLLFSTGLRISEAIALQLEDITPDGLLVRRTKFRKSRLVPLHPTARSGLDRYLARREKVAGCDRSVFRSLNNTGLRYATACATFCHGALQNRPLMGASKPATG